MAEFIEAALNERRIFLAYESVVSATDRQPAFYECLMRIRRTDGALVAANEIVPVAERLGLVRLLDFRVLELVIVFVERQPSARNVALDELSMPSRHQRGLAVTGRGGNHHDRTISVKHLA